MRTLELRDEIFAQAARAAEQRGISVEELVEQAVVRVLNVAADGVNESRPKKIPIIDSGLPGQINITPEIIRQIEHEDDMRRSGLLGYE